MRVDGNTKSRGSENECRPRNHARSRGLDEINMRLERMSSETDSAARSTATGNWYNYIPQKPADRDDRQSNHIAHDKWGNNLPQNCPVLEYEVSTSNVYDVLQDSSTWY